MDINKKIRLSEIAGAVRTLASQEHVTDLYEVRERWDSTAGGDFNIVQRIAVKIGRLERLKELLAHLPLEDLRLLAERDDD